MDEQLLTQCDTDAEFSLKARMIVAISFVTDATLHAVNDPQNNGQIQDF